MPLSCIGYPDAPCDLNDDSGKVRVFKAGADAWTPLGQDILPTAPESLEHWWQEEKAFGQAVSTNGDGRWTVRKLGRIRSS